MYSILLNRLYSSLPPPTTPPSSKPLGSAQPRLIWLSGLLFGLIFSSSTPTAMARSQLQLEVQVIEAKQGEPQSPTILDSSLRKTSALKSMLVKNFPTYQRFEVLRHKENFQYQPGPFHIKIFPELGATLHVIWGPEFLLLATKVQNRRKRLGVTRAPYQTWFFQAFKRRGRTLILAFRAGR
jgi:hypothetical protein